MPRHPRTGHGADGGARAPRSGRRQRRRPHHQHRAARGRAPAAGRLGPDPRRLRHVEDRRGGGGVGDGFAPDDGRGLHRRGRGTLVLEDHDRRVGAHGEVRRRVPRPGRGAARGPHHRARRRRPLQVHGGVRRPHPHDLPPRHRARPAGDRRARARARLPGVRHPDGPRRRRHRRGRDARRHLHVVRRHDAGAGQQRQPARRRPAAPTCASSTRRSTRCASPSRRRTETSCSSPSGSRPRRPRPRSRWCGPRSWASPTSACSATTSRSCRRSRRSSSRPTSASTASSAPATCRPWSATGPTGSCPSSTASRS